MPHGRPRLRLAVPHGPLDTTVQPRARARALARPQPYCAAVLRKPLRAREDGPADLCTVTRRACTHAGVRRWAFEWWAGSGGDRARPLARPQHDARVSGAPAGHVEKICVMSHACAPQSALPSANTPEPSVARAPLVHAWAWACGVFVHVRGRVQGGSTIAISLRGNRSNAKPLSSCARRVRAGLW